MENFLQELAIVNRIGAIPKMLDVICNVTGFGFAMLTRGTPTRWVAYAVRDDLGFGLLAGDDLVLETTICRNVELYREVIAIDQADLDPGHPEHPAMARYGLQSYVGAPIILADGTFFGSLCAIDPRPLRVNTPVVIGLFQLFADLAAFHLREANVVAH